MNDVPEPTPPSPAPAPAPAFNLDDLRLLPDWMKADAPAPPGAARREDRRFENYEDRGPGRGDRDDRRPPQPGGGGGFRGGESRGPRPGGGGGFRENRRDDRGPRPGGGSGGAGGGPRDRRDDRRGGGAPPPRRFEERPAPTRPAPVRVDFFPDPRPLTGIAKEIRSRHLAYPLFGLARMFLERPESHRIRLTAESTPSAKEGEKPGPPPPLFQLGEDGPVALSRATLENLAFDQFRERFYVAQSVQKDPPKGNFTAVARERASGVLLGPPNHHSYQTNLRALYESRYSRRMNFEEFRRGVEIVNDPALVERWKEEFRTVTTYTVRDTLPPEPAGKPEEAKPDEPNAENVQPTPDAPSAPAGEEAAPEAMAEAAPAPEPAPAPGAEADVTTTPETAPTAESPSAPDAPKPVVFENLADVRAHFRQHYLDTIVRSGVRLELPGPAGRQLPEASLTLSLRLAHEQELRYPAGLVQPLRVGLQNTGLHIFKHRKRVVYVSAIRPTPFRTGGETGGAVSEGIAAILETITAQPMISGKELASRVIARRLGPEAPAAKAPEMVDPESIPAPTDTASAEPAATTAATELETAAPGVEIIPPAPAPPDPRQEAIDRFKAHLAADLRYLIGAGHVIAFHNNTFDLPLPPRPKEEPKPAPKPAVATAVKPSGATTTTPDPGTMENAAPGDTVLAEETSPGDEEETGLEAFLPADPAAPVEKMDDDEATAPVTVTAAPAAPEETDAPTSEPNHG